MRPRVLTLFATATTLVLCTGCPQYRSAHVPGEITQHVEPDSDCPYRVYVPSTYDRDHKWPLVILCHGTRPWDTAKRQMADWVKLAEEHGFIVAAPELVGTSEVRRGSADKQIARQIEDESRILSVVRSLRGAYNVSEDRIFLCGWSAGGYAVTYTGLKHADIFRALAIQQGNFDAVYLVDVANQIDVHQPICVIYGASDLLAGRQSRECVEWLQEHGANVMELEVGGGHRGHPKRVQEYFEHVLREMPWLHIRPLPETEADPLTVRFKIRSSFVPNTYWWSFGDGSDSPVAEPVHRYVEPGTYRVTLTATTPQGQSVARTADVEVPQLQTLTPRRTTWDDQP